MNDTLKPLGWQTIVDLYDCQSAFMGDVDWIRSVMLELATIVEATVVTETFHQFSPHGISGVVVISESHIAIHTWPEHNYVAIDIFSCVKSLANRNAVEFLVSKFESKNSAVKNFTRGNLSIGNGNI